jgi:hypothetical protein
MFNAIKYSFSFFLFLIKLGDFNVPRGGRVDAPMRAVCPGVSGPLQNRSKESIIYAEGFIQSVREQMSGHKLNRQKPPVLFILFVVESQSPP